jgi:membrane-bound inhibitor of C-type lysozyme
MKIEWNKVTKLSQIVAVVLFVFVFFVGFQIGRTFEKQFILGAPITKSVKFVCADNKTINAEFYKNFVHLEFGFQKTLYLSQTISASGARYANGDESIVFWNKGDTAFITEGDPNKPTYRDCLLDKNNN